MHMNWTFYSITYIAKFIVIGGLVLLFAVAIPVIVSIILLGMILSYLRDTESHPMLQKPSRMPFSSLSDHLILTHETISRIQHALLRRD